MKAIFARAPLRISLGGGATDLPSYYEQHGGFSIAGAIDKYVYLLVHDAFQRRYLMQYSETEEVDRPDELRNPILREVLGRWWSGNPLHVASVADVPKGTGLGSSGTFTVCLLRALAYARRTVIAPGALAEEAAHIEIDVLREPVGKMDPYAAAHGGICSYAFHENGEVTVEPLELGRSTIAVLEERLLLFFTGGVRDASSVLADQSQRTQAGDEEMLENLHATKRIGALSKFALLNGNLDGFGELLHEHWLTKCRRSNGITTSRADDLYERARAAGATGGKLVGAGGGGFLLVYASDPEKVRAALSDVTELPFAFEFTGATARDA